MLRKAFIVGVYLFLLFLGLEFCIALLVQSGHLNIIMPTYSLEGSEDFLPERSYVYGHRHQPNSTYPIRKNCFETTYQFNTLGFRDENPKKNSSETRVLLLGDSFTEGLGVDEDQRFGDILEKKTGIAHLNFGMADKGTTQAAVIYDSIASKYDHQAVIFSVFPINDFIDDDPELGKNEESIRPCWVGKYPNYTLEFIPEDAPAEKPKSIVKHFLKRYTYTYDAIYFLKEQLKMKFITNETVPKSNYFNYSQEQLNRMKYSIQSIKILAKGKPILVLCIPSHLELLSDHNQQSSIELDLADFCKQNEVGFIGLRDYFQKASLNAAEEFYLSCDSHWNAGGHKFVANIIQEKSHLYTFLK